MTVHILWRGLCHPQSAAVAPFPKTLPPFAVGAAIAKKWNTSRSFLLEPLTQPSPYLPRTRPRTAAMKGCQLGDPPLAWSTLIKTLYEDRAEGGFFGRFGTLASLLSGVKFGVPGHNRETTFLAHFSIFLGPKRAHAFEDFWGMQGLSKRPK